MIPTNIQFNTINLPVTDASLRNQMQQMARFRNLIGDNQIHVVCAPSLVTVMILGNSGRFRRFRICASD